MKNELARELSLAEGKHQYDNQVKRKWGRRLFAKDYVRVHTLFTF